jgi:hypothetical protein
VAFTSVTEEKHEKLKLGQVDLLISYMKLLKFIITPCHKSNISVPHRAESQICISIN